VTSRLRADRDLGVAPAFERRAARAETLVPQSATAHEPLDFAAGLYRAQQSMATAIEATAAERGLVGRLDQDLDGFADAIEIMLRFAAERAPPALSEAARNSAGADLHARLVGWWNHGGSGAGSGSNGYLERALLRPYAEVLRALDLAPVRRPPAAGACAFCGGMPWIAWRVASASSEGAQRFLGCALCGGEWSAGRIRCPSCAEERPDKLASFQSERYPTVRIETCASCRAYVKSIDLTIDARAIPEVDDLLSLSMDLWAVEEGYARIEPGLAGI
jgi:hypothetical protein